jgi:restriction system protein
VHSHNSQQPFSFEGAKMKDVTLWGIHAGRYGEAHSLFMRKNVVALGYVEMGDFSKLQPDRESFKAAIAQTYPEMKPGAVPNQAGQIFRFIHEMKVGDIVVYPSKSDKKVNIGKVESEYLYSRKSSKVYPHQRSVKWLQSFPRTHFSQGALYEIGSAISFFQVKNFADEFIAALQGRPSSPPAKEDETISIVSKDIEQNTRDFIVKQLAQELKGHPFAEFIAHLLGNMGYHTRLSPEGPDGGIDIIAHRDELGFEPPIIKVQVKSSEGSVGDPVVSALYGKVEPNEHGLLITLGTFTNPAKNFAKNKSNLRLIDGDELVDLILEHYESFDSKYKGIIPLKRVFIPEPLSEE